ncbi:hypothetical protein [Saccharothrix deserti]|uniref:hypothetical protein n=1 Tax=Saccharothrix deserti TaxID=2593674 RepID=UPI00131CE448|nr:hypothetical protein [Saccharothrix deserti]
MSSFSRNVLRHLDLLALRFEFANLILMHDGPFAGQLMREQAGQDAFIVVHFPPQHVAETVLPAAGSFDVPLPGRVAGPSRLGFRLRPGVERIPFTLQALLDWASLDSNLVPVARPPRGTVFDDPVQAPPLQAPQPTETALELPYRLILSPHPGGGWAHSIEPVTRQGRTELWHTRLGVRADGTGVVDEHQAEGRYVRAVFSPDPGGPPPGISTTSPQPEDRNAIVHLSADFTLRTDRGAYRPEPLEIDRLMLSSRGGWLRARGEWDPPNPFTLSQWHHVATQGRDHFVRTAHEGFLFPFGHRAAHIEITERVIETSTTTPPRVAAVLRKRHFVVVREPVKTYTAAGFAHQGREMPFARSLGIMTLSTPAALGEIPGIGGPGAFWVMKDPPSSGPVPFHLVGTDLTGENTDFHAALIFVRRNLLTEPDPGVRESFLTAIRNAYREAADGPSGPRRRIPVGGARVTFAPPADPAAPGETTLITEALAFDVHIAGGAPVLDGQLPFLPSLSAAEVRLPAVEQLVGSAKPVEIALSKAFLNAGIDVAGNPAQLFAEVTAAVGNALKVDLPAERGGALAKPNMAVRALSRSLGPLGGTLDQLAAGKFTPEDFFADGAKLLGAVSLKDLVSEASDFVSARSQFPQMVSRTMPTAVVATLDWEPKVKDSVGPLKARPPGISFALHARMERPLDDSPTRSSVTTTLKNFTFAFLGVLEVHFNTLTFRSENGGKPDVSAELAPEGVVFQPPLSFLNSLRRFIPAGGFSKGPVFDVSPSGVKVGYSLALPPVAVGVFALQNVKLGASLNLPFTDGKASLRFNFAERHDEFLLTVQGLGGGGFFVMALGLDGIEMIEAALEFGAAVAMNFGVASGGVSIMAGVYFRYEVLDAAAVPVKAMTRLSGYLRLNGEVEVLGLVSVSIELSMTLTYEDQPEQRIEGVATLVIKIDLTLFSESVELTVRRSFAKGQGDPTFGDVVSEADWAAYADAFA